MSTHPSPNPDVAGVYASYPEPVRRQLLVLRELIFETAASTPDVGAITETLKWGEPAYLTEASKAGSTIRLGWKPTAPEHYAMYFNCQTDLVDTFRTFFPELNFEGNRALILHVDQAQPCAELEKCIQLALTYHLRKKRRVRNTAA